MAINKATENHNEDQSNAMRGMYYCGSQHLHSATIALLTLYNVKIFICSLRKKQV
ncbi:hypothetical protein A359_02430 [secondary endosymbiont of Ctenarytaina eucalypti]|uniref:Uncharacterized protein n=1 Tax=secondary endosymbiont of Ctenarytaina eucalypti TaxID=1199245 RepID=J3Z341_9ENTR|nr:hypothetical protein A359_02430 [secondary endosymbiont of Ctenarytaina eucalypti]